MTFAASVTIADLPVGTTGTAPKEGSLTTAMLSFGTRSGGPNSGHIPQVQRNPLVRELGQEARAVTAQWCVIKYSRGVL